MVSGGVLRRVSRAEIIEDRILRAILRWRVRRQRALDLPRLACVPSDGIGQVIALHGVYEADLLAALFDVHLSGMREEFSRSTALDVGANIGNHTAWFARRFARVVSFEPNPPTLALLRANVVLGGLDNVEVHPVGLSDEDAELAFVQDDANLGGSHFVSDDSSGATASLQVRRGDDLLAGEERPRVALVKIDVEGHEVRALRGLEATLRADHPVVLFECRGHENPGEGRAVVGLLREFGYSRFEVVEPPPVGGGPRALRLLRRLWLGGDLRVYPIEEPDDRFYALIIARAD